MARYNPKILLIDDSQVSHAFLNMILKRQGYIFLEPAFNIDSGLARENQADAVLIDVLLDDQVSLPFLRQFSKPICLWTALDKQAVWDKANQDRVNITGVPIINKDDIGRLINWLIRTFHAKAAQ